MCGDTTILIVRPGVHWCPAAWLFDAVVDAVSPALGGHDPALGTELRSARASDGRGVLDVRDWSPDALGTFLVAVVALRTDPKAGKYIQQLDSLIGALRADARVASMKGKAMLIADIVSARDAGIVRCGFSPHTASLRELATTFGLAPDSEHYREIDAHYARRVVEYVLTKDLAYEAEIMPDVRASVLADQFFAQCRGAGARFYTNGSFDPVQPRLASWNPVTSATFDTGVVVVGPPSGCLWVEDED